MSCICLLTSMTLAQSAEANTSKETVSDDAASTPTHIAPRFPGCEDKEIPGKYKYLCSQKRFVNYLERYIKYPKSASKRTIQGKVIISFIVEKDGTVSNAIVERTPSDILSQVCLETINQLNDEDYIWTPAIVDGENVRSRVQMPIDFRIGYKSIKSKRPMTYVKIPDLMPSVPVDDDGMAVQTSEEHIQMDKVYDDVEERPYFQNCSVDQITLIERYKCSRSSYKAYIEEHLVYPEEAKRKRIQGLAKVECIIETDGSVTSPRLLRDPGAGLGDEALRLITQMKDSIGLWSPGEIGGQQVRTLIEIPIKFQLEAEDVNPLVIIMDKRKKILHDCIREADLSVIKSIEGAKVKELSTKKARKLYGEKGRYGVYLVKLPKGKGRLPSVLKNQEEVEAYEMYFDGLTLAAADMEGKIDISFDSLNDDAEIIVYGLNGRSVLKESISKGTDVTSELDLSETRGDLFFVSIVQKDLVHTRLIKL